MSALTISERTQNMGTEHAFAVLAEVNAMIAAGDPIISFGIGQPDFKTPRNICEVAKKAIDDGHHGYTPSAGIPELKQAVVSYLNRTRNLAYAPEDIAVANGAKPFIMYAIMAVTDHGAGHEVLYPNPGFPIYHSQITMSGAVPKKLNLLEKYDFAFDIDDLKAQLSPATRLLILNSPHNPTGRTLSADELGKIADVLQDYPQCWVFSDEVYSQMVHGQAFASISQIPGMKERTIVVDGASKTYAMTGWRLGFAANKQLASYFANWVTNTDSCANAITQWATVEALTCDQAPIQEMMDSFARRCDLIYEGLKTLPGISVTKPGGAFYIWPNVSEMCQMVGAVDSEVLRKRWLNEAKVAVLNDNHFGHLIPGDGYHVRFSYATSTEHIEEGINRLSDWMKKAKR